MALKVFAVDPGGRDFDHQRFVWEAQVAELVSGRPNLPEVLGSGFTDDGRPYLVTKLYRHGTLRRRVDVGGPLDECEVAAAGRQLAIALAALHENGMLHGDVKPENVFIDDDDNLVLGDLGAAWVRTDGRPPSMITPAYAAPEVWLGHAPTTASDIYSLGLTLLFAATGRAPTPGSPPSEDEIVAAFGSTRPRRCSRSTPAGGPARRSPPPAASGPRSMPTPCSASQRPSTSTGPTDRAPDRREVVSRPGRACRRPSGRRRDTRRTTRCSSGSGDRFSPAFHESR